MKKAFYLIITQIAINFSTQAAVPDTLDVSDSSTVYLVFPTAVEMADLGQSDQYFLKLEGSVVFIKAKHPEAKPTSLFLKSQENFMVTYLRYRAKPVQNLYDFRDSRTVKTKTTGEYKELADLDLVNQHVDYLYHKQSKGAIRKKKEDNLKLKLTDIMQDKQATYLKFNLRNSSSIDYHIELVSFQYLQNHRKRRIRKKKMQMKEMTPLLTRGKEVIPAGLVENLVYAIPAYAPGLNGSLQITFREKNGNRTISLFIKGRRLSKANRLE